MELEATQRSKVERYLRQHCLEEMLDEVLNQVVETMPESPCVEIARLGEYYCLRPSEYS
jgi:hypothetical protein